MYTCFCVCAFVRANAQFTLRKYVLQFMMLRIGVPRQKHAFAVEPALTLVTGDQISIPRDLYDGDDDDDDGDGGDMSDGGDGGDGGGVDDGIDGDNVGDNDVGDDAVDNDNNNNSGNADNHHFTYYKQPLCITCAAADYVTVVVVSLNYTA
jgi:hypothetical protein